MRKVVAGGLRFVRSSSASLPPSVMRQMEKLFHVPVIEAYGMTEAAHQNRREFVGSFFTC
jgi:acyl-CoA synthetase (AMP-forming)/AMP-acid ligase II